MRRARLLGGHAEATACREERVAAAPVPPAVRGQEPVRARLADVHERQGLASFGGGPHEPEGTEDLTGAPEYKEAICLINGALRLVPHLRVQRAPEEHHARHPDTTACRTRWDAEAMKVLDSQMGVPVGSHV